MEALIDPTNPADPIAAQFRPDARELEIAPDELSDPIGDEAYTPVKGVVHRYADRCLLKLVHVCPVYCRFCFRRERVGPQGDGTLTGAERQLNVKGAYAASRRYDIAGARILLVDDVLTTGATVDACARTLLRAKAANVDVLVFARVSGDTPSVRLHARVLGEVRSSAALLARLNDLNARVVRPAFFHASGSVYAVADIPASPFEGRHVVQALRELCDLADGVDELLQSEFGGHTTFADEMPSTKLH
jgi:hypothetical protein